MSDAFARLDWTSFAQLEASPRFEPSDFKETLDGGQAFTWNEVDNLEYVGVFSNNVARVKLQKNGKLAFSAPKKSDRARLERELENYLDFSRDYSAIRKKLKTIKDARLTEALDAFPTIRILRQNPAETIIAFICSSSKRIPQIKQCVKLLREKFGEKLVGEIKTMPRFSALAKASVEEIAECKLGFRSAYLKNSAMKIVEEKFEAETLRTLNYKDAKEYLLKLNGIGAKVADCILLFGAARFQAFPIDTWIRQAMASLYDLPNDPKKILAFAASHFGEHAGFAQQLLFAHIRKISKK